MAKRKSDSGFALLFIFCMAAIVAILLFSATPRSAFEAERDQEQLLIDRGEQYKRAIQVYYRTLHHYPPKLEDLERTGNQRFLRRRYADPFTGSTEWRLVHVGPGGILTDSVNGKKKPAGNGSVNTFITELPQVGGGDLTGGSAANVGLRRRASEQPGAPGMPSTDSAVDLNGNPTAGGGVNVPLPIGVDGRPVMPPSLTGGQPNSVPRLGNGAVPLPGSAGGLSAGGYPNPTGVMGSGYPNPTGAFGGPPVSGQPPAGGNPNIPGVVGPQGAQGNNPAAAMIQNMLTSPRPGGYPGAQAGAFPPGQQPGAQTAGGLVGPQPQNGLQAGTGSSTVGAFAAPGGAIGAGIAGVASKDEHEGIKVYNEKTKHNEWEFIYDYGKESTARTNVPAAQAPPGSPIGQALKP
jgi:hypothetical protein